MHSNIKPVRARLVWILPLVLFAGFFSAPEAWPQFDKNPRAVAMGGAFTAVARNLESTGVNPANLGLDSPRNFTLLLGLPSIYFDMRNTAFSLSDIDRYSGKYLTVDDKNVILDKVSNALGLHLNAGYDLLGFSYGRFGMNLSLDSFSEIHLPRAPFDLLLNGTYIGQKISFTDLKGDSQTAVVAAFSYAHPLDEVTALAPLLSSLGLTRTSAGITVKPLFGLENIQFRTATGIGNINNYSMDGKADITLRAAGVAMKNNDNRVELNFKPGFNGTGLAFDLGLAASRGDNLTFGIALRNLFGSIHWNKTTYEARVTASADSLNVMAVAQDSTNVARFYTHSDSSYAVGAYSTDIPATLSFGAAYRFTPSPSRVTRMLASEIIGAVDLELGFSNMYYASTSLRLSFGIEQKCCSGYLPLRYGLSFGGGDSAVFSWGLGLNLPGFKWDVGFTNHGITDGKGLRISTRFWYGK